MATALYSRSIPEIFTDLGTHFATLVRTEGQLARAEISENIGKVVAGMAFLVGGAVLLIPALVILLQAAVAVLIENGIATSTAAAMVGGVVVVIGLIFLLIGWSRLKANSLVPSRTIRQLQEDVSVAKEQTRQHHDVH